MIHEDDRPYSPPTPDACPLCGGELEHESGMIYCSASHCGPAGMFRLEAPSLSCDRCECCYWPTHDEWADYMGNPIRVFKGQP